MHNRPSVKILNFWKSKMAAAAILKITKIAISPQRFDRSLWNLVRWCKMGLKTSLTFKKFESHKSKMADGLHFAKTVKVSYLCNHFTDFDEIWHDDANLPLTAERPLKFRIYENPRPRKYTTRVDPTSIIPSKFEVDIAIHCRVIAFSSGHTSRDLVTFTFDLLTLNSWWTWGVTWPTLPPSLNTICLSVLDLLVITFPFGYHRECVRGHCACAESRDP